MAWVVTTREKGSSAKMLIQHDGVVRLSNVRVPVGSLQV